MFSIFTYMRKGCFIGGIVLLHIIPCTRRTTSSASLLSTTWMSCHVRFLSVDTTWHARFIPASFCPVVSLSVRERMHTWNVYLQYRSYEAGGVQRLQWFGFLLLRLFSLLLFDKLAWPRMPGITYSTHWWFQYRNIGPSWSLYPGWAAECGCAVAYL